MPKSVHANASCGVTRQNGEVLESELGPTLATVHPSAVLRAPDDVRDETYAGLVADLTEIDVVNLEEGQPVTVSLDAIPDAQLTGEILSIGQTFAENQGDIVYEVTILLTEAHPSMRWGMTAAVNFARLD